MCFHLHLKDINCFSKQKEYRLLHLLDVDLNIFQQIVGTNFNLSDMFHFNTGSVQIYS